MMFKATFSKAKATLTTHPNVYLIYLSLAALTIPDTVFSEGNSSSAIKVPVTLSTNIESPFSAPVTFMEGSATGKFWLFSYGT